MKATLCTLLCFGALVCLADEGPPQQRALWERAIQKVHAGMRRAEVEKLLPPYVAPAAKAPGILPYSSTVINAQGGSQTVAYFVSPGWRVSVPYDYTGIPQDAKGVSDYRGPDNRVVGDVTLLYLPEPAAAPTAPKAP